jgi:Crinkler effector protein N-terminal domain
MSAPKQLEKSLTSRLLGKSSPSTDYNTPALTLALNHRQRTRRQLNCLINGQSVFVVTVVCRLAVRDLKKQIKLDSERELGSLKEVDPHTRELWKVSAIDDREVKRYVLRYFF